MGQDKKIKANAELNSAENEPWFAKFTKGDEEYNDYMANEWAHPCYDDQKLFEMLTLEGAQAGLSWSTILHKREGYRSAFASFDIKKVAKMSEARQKALLCNSGIVRHAGKIKSVILNAKAALQVQKEEGSLSTFLWSFVGGLPQNTRRSP